MPPHLTAREIELYATNTGHLYDMHKGMARDCASLSAWIIHVRYRILPAYRREIEPAYAMPCEVREAAEALRAYYADHIREAA